MAKTLRERGHEVEVLELERASVAAALGAAKEAAVAAERRVAALARSLERVEAEVGEASPQAAEDVGGTGDAEGLIVAEP